MVPLSVGRPGSMAAVAPASLARGAQILSVDGVDMINASDQASLDTLNLEPAATLQDVKQRFKELVKRFHPDANGGDRGAEENLRQVIKAYGQLRSSGFS